MAEFKEWPKISRLNRTVVVTEKIDGTNACVVVSDAPTLDERSEVERELVDVLRRNGFRKCDVPACNCDSWHQVDGYAARFREIDDAVGDHNGKTLLQAVQEVVAERDAARAEAKKYHDALVARHGGEPVALLSELDAARAECARVAKQRDELIRAKTGNNPDDYFCCSGMECGCHGVTVREYELHCVDRAIASEQPKRDWPEDAADADNGQYQCLCSVCGASFVGHKRRVLCKACASGQPKPTCHLCGLPMPDGTDGHGLGECVPVCPTCDGSGTAQSGKPASGGGQS